jgi:hypothetical protein
MKRMLAYLVIIACAALFVGAASWLLLARIEQGNVYPAASSLRTDPLGAMVLWESLAALPGLDVERDHSPVTRLPKGHNTTYLHLGGRRSAWEFLSASDAKAIEQFLLEGGRLVVTLHPDPYWAFRNEDKKSDASPGSTPDASPSPSPASPKKDQRVGLRSRWNVTLGDAKTDEKKLPAVLAAKIPGLPETLPWHSRTILEDLGPAWTVVYTRGGLPVIAEMKRGPGTVVFLTDAYLLSNEALVRDRQSALIAWLLGPHTHIVFDEAHHGITDSPGLASMARRYGLTGAAFAFLGWAGLFLWKNSSSLAPRRKNQSSSNDPVAGRPSFGGFVAMLRRNIAPANLFTVCWNEWEKTFSRSRRFADKRKAAAAALVAVEAKRPPNERNPVEAYRRVHHILHQPSTEP